MAFTGSWQELRFRWSFCSSVCVRKVLELKASSCNWLTWGEIPGLSESKGIAMLAITAHISTPPCGLQVRVRKKAKTAGEERVHQTMP